MASLTTTLSLPVTRVATFQFHPHITATQKADRARAFLELDTKLELTGVKREKEWDLGFVVVFKV
jgi:hypothetical protein